MRWAAVLFSCLSIVCAASPAEAQRFEIHPYGGVFFPGKFADVLNIHRDGIYGVKGGIFVSGAIEAEGNVAYINNLAFEGTLTSKKGYIWEGLASYHFRVPHVQPHLYGTFGVGGLTTGVSADSRDFWGASIPTADTFISLTYGGGVKALQLFGPLGYRAEIRGRTLPHYYGFRLNWIEATGGLTLSWGGQRQKQP